MKVAIYQMLDRGDPEENLKAAFEAIIRTEADFLVLPEFFSIPGGDFRRRWTIEEAYEEAGRPALEMLRRASLRFPGYIIGGSVIEKEGGDFYNTCFVFRRGELITRYRKRHPTPEEKALGIREGREGAIFPTPFGRVGILICADCLFERTRDEIASRSDLLFLPISLTDPRHPRTEGHPISRKMAEEHDVVVVKASRIGIFEGRKIAARSAVIAPQGVLYEAGEEEELALLEIRL